MTCAEAAQASFLDPDDPDCTGACKETHALGIFIRDLYYINMADMVFEILCSLFAAATYYGLVWKSDDKEKRARRTGRILMISFLVDLAFQASALFRQWGCSSIVNMIFEAECLRYGHGVAGTEGRDTLIRLQASLQNVLLVGLFEFIVAVAGVAADVLVLRKIDKGSAYGPTAPRPPSPAHGNQLRFQALGLALLDAVLSTLDFFFATMASAAESEKLLAHVGDNEWWCTHGDDI